MITNKILNKYVLLILTAVLPATTIFAQAKPEKLVGQVVCSACWFEEADRNKKPYGNAADIKCAVECSEGNIAGQSLAVRSEQGEFVLYEMLKGDFQLKAKDFLEFVPKVVEVEGTVRKTKDKNFIRVNSIRVVDDPTLGGPSEPVEAKLALNDLHGIPQDLKNYRGRMVVVNFWATWCVPCKEEMPDLAAIQNDYAAHGVQVIGAGADEEQEKAKVTDFVREVKVNFPIWLGLKNAEMQGFGIGKALPSTVIVDREGKIVWRRIGKIDARELRRELDKLLAKKTGAAAIKD